jgi:mannose-6-phosphate isomerase-like protein (cupin superfamily)
MIRGGWLLLLCAGCPGPSTPPTGPDPGPRQAATADAAPGEVDARLVSDEEKLAMIERGMNQLAPIASQCWAAGAVDDYLLEGTVVLQIAPHRDGARVAVVHDTTDDKVLTGCLQTIASAYAWPAELAGEVVELPFAFDAPDGQFVIDRRLVPINGQAGVGVAVLLDEKNANNPAASMLELTFKAKATSALAKTERHEVWVITAGSGTIGGADKALPGTVARGSVIDLPAGAYRTATAGDAGMSAIVFLVPGQIEGVARGGALPGQTVFGAVTDKKPAGPRLATRASYRADKRVVEIYLDSAGKGAAKDVAVSELILEAGAAVPEHTHANETEMLYVLSGSGSMVIDGVTLPLTPTTVVQIPKGKAHKAEVSEATRVIQLYTPGGPEQRFKAK